MWAEVEVCATISERAPLGLSTYLHRGRVALGPVYPNPASSHHSSDTSTSRIRIGLVVLIRGVCGRLRAQEDKSQERICIVLGLREVCDECATDFPEQMMHKLVRTTDICDMMHADVDEVLQCSL